MENQVYNSEVYLKSLGVFAIFTNALLDRPRIQDVLHRPRLQKANMKYDIRKHPPSQAAPALGEPAGLLPLPKEGDVGDCGDP